jgi:hypothetical protein
MYPKHALFEVARSLCLRSDQQVELERLRLEQNLRRFHPIYGRWSRVGYAGCLVFGVLSPVFEQLVSGAPSSMPHPLAVAAFNIIAMAGMLWLASRVLTKELFHVQPLAPEIDLRRLAGGTEAAQRFVTQVALLRSQWVAADLRALRALSPETSREKPRPSGRGGCQE